MRKSAFAIEREMREQAALAKIREREAEQSRLAEAREIPEGCVLIKTTTQRYKRTINGAWWYGGTDFSTRLAEEPSLNEFYVGYSSHEIIWPDGHREGAGFDSSLYASCHGTRLAVLNKYALALLPWRKPGIMGKVGNATLVDEWCRHSETLDGITSNRYAQDFAWTKPTKLDQKILDHFNEQHPNL